MHRLPTHPRRPHSQASRRRWVTGCVAVALVPAALLVGVQAADTGNTRIYSCIDGKGRRLSSDRPIPECLTQEQKMLGRDGSQRGTMPPLISPEQQARENEERDRQQQERARREDQARRDRNLLTRYPDPAAHDLARARALETVQERVRQARSRLDALNLEALKLTAERSALGLKPPSAELRAKTSANEGATEAQRNILRNQESERDRVMQQFVLERERLNQLWAGAVPGSDPAPATPPTAPPNSRQGTRP